MNRTIAEILDDLSAPEPRRLGSGDVGAICDAIEEATVSADRSGLREISETLEKGFRHLLASGPVDDPADPDLQVAFSLGQIGCAQALAARMFDRRPAGGRDEALAALRRRAELLPAHLRSVPNFVGAAVEDSGSDP